MNNFIIDENLLKYVLDQEAKKIVGKVCKRFEISDDIKEIKAQVKELLYEHCRDLQDSILNVSKKENSIHLVNIDEKSKE
jgi:hypothetical protein